MAVVRLAGLGLSLATGTGPEAVEASNAPTAALLCPPLIPTTSARQVAGLGVGAIYVNQCAPRLRSVNQAVTMVVPVIGADNGQRHFIYVDRPSRVLAGCCWPDIDFYLGETANEN